MCGEDTRHDTARTTARARRLSTAAPALAPGDAGASVDAGPAGTDDARGQAHTLEAFTAALLILSGVVFALQATAVTPLSASTSNQHIENQQAATGETLLSVSDANGTLRTATLFWNRSENEFVGASDEAYYTGGGPPNAFGAALNDTFAEDRVAFNVYVEFRRPGNAGDRQQMVYMGTPSDNAAAASRTVVLYDDTSLTGSTGNVSAAAAAGEFYAPDAAPADPLFNVLEVHIITWRI